MKSKLLIIAGLSLSALIYSGCKLEDNPTNAVTTASLTTTSDGLLNAVNGAYALFKDHEEFQGTTDLNNMYLRQYFQMSDFASDDVVCAQVTTDPLFPHVLFKFCTEPGECKLLLVHILQNNQ